MSIGVPTCTSLPPFNIPMWSPNLNDSYKSLRTQNFEQWHSIQTEDLNSIEGMQEGRNSPVYNGGNFSPVLDNPTHHFNKWVATALTDNDFSKN